MSRIQFSSTDAADSSTVIEFGSRSTDAWLWGVAVVALVLDVVLTYYGLSLGLKEGNPIARSFFSMLGVLEAMVLLKGTVMAMALVAWVALPRQYRIVVPIGVALPWLVASAINATLILQV